MRGETEEQQGSQHQGLAAKSRQVMEACAAFISSTKTMFLFYDKENQQPVADGNVIEEGLGRTPGKRKAATEPDLPGSNKRVPVTKSETAARIPAISDDSIDSDEKSRIRMEETGTEATSSLAKVSETKGPREALNALTRELSTMTIAESDPEDLHQPKKPGVAHQHSKMRRDVRVAVELPPTPSEPDFPTASPVEEGWPRNRGLAFAEGVYPTPSPDASGRAFFAHETVIPSDWYSIQGSQEDGEPSVQDLDDMEEADPLYLREYAEEIHRYLKNLEGKSKIRRNYFDTQPFLTWQMRTDLIDWLMDICNHLRFNSETLHHTCVLLDLYLSISSLQILPKHFQLIGSACFLLAAKAEEIEPPTLSWLTACSDGAFDRDRLRAAEINVLSTLGWNVGGFTNMTHFLARAKRAEAVGKTKHTAEYLVELAIFERRFLGENPSLVCSAAVWLARQISAKKECWTPSLEYHLDQSPASLSFQHCVRILFERLREGSPSQALLHRHQGTAFAAERWAHSMPMAEIEKLLRNSAAKFSAEPLSPTLMASSRLPSRVGPAPPRLDTIPPNLMHALSFERR